MESEPLGKNKASQRPPLALALWRDDELQVFAISRWNSVFVAGAIAVFAWFFTR